MAVEVEEKLLIQEPELVIDYVVASAQPALPEFPKNNREMRLLVDAARKGLMASNGADHYNRLMGRFSAVLDWAFACWDHLVTTRGCRFVPRDETERSYHRGCYRAFTQHDYRRFINRTFKYCLFEYDSKSQGDDFPGYVSRHLWKRITEDYDGMLTPDDPEERKLTGYSYLRCIPYTFFNDCHEARMQETLAHLDPETAELVELYFFKFMTISAIAGHKSMDIDPVKERINNALARVRSIDPICGALLAQVERY